MRSPRIAPNTFVAPAGNWFKYGPHGPFPLLLARRRWINGSCKKRGRFGNTKGNRPSGWSQEQIFPVVLQRRRGDLVQCGSRRGAVRIGRGQSGDRERFCCDAPPVNPLQDLLYLVRDPWPWGKPHEAAGIHRTYWQRCSRMAARAFSGASKSARVTSAPISDVVRMRWTPGQNRHPRPPDMPDKCPGLSGLSGSRCRAVCVGGVVFERGRGLGERARPTPR